MSSGCSTVAKLFTEPGALHFCLSVYCPAKSAKLLLRCNESTQLKLPRERMSAEEEQASHKQSNVEAKMNGPQYWAGIIVAY